MSSCRHEPRDPAKRHSRGASANWGISISVAYLPGFVAVPVPQCISDEGAAEDVRKVLHVGKHALVRWLRAAGHGGRPRGGAGRAVRAEARHEERSRADRHHLRILRVAGRDNALALLRVLLGAQGRAIRAAQGVKHSHAANQHYTNAHLLYAPHR